MHNWVKSANAVLFAVLILLVPAVQAQETRTLPQSDSQMQLSFAPLVRQTAGTVVNVYAERMVQQRTLFDDDPFFSQFFGQQMPNRTEKQSSLGSGVIVGRDGTIITNNHVIEGADDIKIALADGREFECTVVLKDERVDLAVLKIRGKAELDALPLGDSDAVEVGDLVLAIGNPFGIGQTVTSGIVSGLARNKVGVSDFGFFIQTDASINPGNSGGALLDMNGRLIGINSAIFSKGGGSNGVGFAIPVNLVKVFLQAAEAGRTLERPYIGATFDPVTSEVAEALGTDKVRGALVTKIVEGGPADKAGLKPGEIVLAVDGHPVEHPDALGYRLLTAGMGAKVTLTLNDNGTTREASLQLDAAPETTPRDERTIAGRNPFSGSTVANLSPKLAEELRMPTESSGVVITALKGNAIAARLGFEPRDIIAAINDTPVDSTRDLENMIDDDPSVWRVEIIRNGERIRQIFR